MLRRPSLANIVRRAVAAACAEQFKAQNIICLLAAPAPATRCGILKNIAMVPHRLLHGSHTSHPCCKNRHVESCCRSQTTGISGACSNMHLPTTHLQHAFLSPRGHTQNSKCQATGSFTSTVLPGETSQPYPPALTYSTQSHPHSQQTQQSRSGTISENALVAFYADHNVVPLPPGHRFPMGKYAETRAALQADPSLEGCMEFRPGPAANLRDLLLVHDAEYIERFRSNNMLPAEMRNVGFPWSQELVNRTYSSCGGTVAATRLVLDDSRPMAANIAGGTHHAFRDRGEGFCIFNDIAVAAAVALRDYSLQRILVLDLDVHQGNGTAAIFEDESRVVTFDMHGDKNYPWKSRMRNTYDVALPDGTGDESYLQLLGSWLPRLIEQHQPQLMVFQAGVDALKGDSFGRLALTRQGLIQRNNMVYSTALQHGIPLVITMGGGYTRPMTASVECHTDVYRVAAYRYRAWVAERQRQSRQHTDGLVAAAVATI